VGLKDRLRETARVAQDGLAMGQAKLDEYNARQENTERLRVLGQALWVRHSGRATDGRLAELLAELGPAIAGFEAAHGPLDWPTIETPSAAATTTAGADRPEPAASRGPDPDP
jgi:hypothetical protein